MASQTQQLADAIDQLDALIERVKGSASPVSIDLLEMARNELVEESKKRADARRRRRKP